MRRDTRRFLFQLLVVFLGYFIAGKLGQATTNIRSSNLGPVWPAYGIALAAVLGYGYRVWPAILASAFVVAVQGAVSPVAAFGQAAGATIASVAGGYWLRRLRHFDPSLPRLHDALGLIILGAFCSAIVSSSIGTASLYATGVQPYDGLRSSWVIYWLGDGTGVLLVTPLVFTIPQLLRLRSPSRIGEGAALVTMLAAACFIVFGAFPAIPVRLDALAFAILPFVMWGAIRFGIAGAGVSVVLIATIATVLTALGLGPFAIGTPLVNAVLLDVLFAVLAVSGISLAAVIAERERAEYEREQLVRKQTFVEVQEQERARIARELHDDIGQRLAMLAINLTGMSDELRAQATEIASDVQALSRELHPSRVELLGLPGAVKSACREFAAQYGMTIDCRPDSVLRKLPSDMSVGLFRVLQEALHNVAKHSGVQRCDVELWEAFDVVHLLVSDRGVGFDDGAPAGNGLGLLSMQERMKLIGGELSIDSRRQHGTTVHARAPIRSA
jgi:signal transduction histidine kinase